MNIQKELTYTEFTNREKLKYHRPYEVETTFFQAIKLGDIEKTKELYSPVCAEEGFGRLSDNKIRNLKYHMVISIALITRYCIEGGLEMETAYNLSDIYILKVDRCDDMEELNALHKEMVLEFTKKMHIFQKRKRYSKPIILCIDYIYDNLHGKISLSELADVSNLSEAYLSKLFHKEIGMTISQYITMKKIESAKNLMNYSDYTSADIANILCFSSESHFINVFKKIEGVTPKEYKKEHFRGKNF